MPEFKGQTDNAIDHRVMDGAAGARAIRTTEAMLNGPVLEELRGLA